MGFALQLLSNGASRLVYMYLLGVLNQLAIDYSTPHATLLANANGLCALFSLNAYQFYIAKQTGNPSSDLTSCDTQFKLVLVLWLVATCLMLGLSNTMVGAQVLPTLVAALALALPELTFTIATAKNKPWRAILFYGTQAIFFGGYALAIHLRTSPLLAALYASMPTVAINLLAYQMLRSRHAHQPFTSTALRTLGQECKERLGTLAASLPIIATPSAMAYGLGLDPGTTAQIPQMLLFSSFVGAVVFIMGNVFQHYGKDMVPRLLTLQNNGDQKSLALLITGVLALCLCLTFPVDLLLSYVRHSFQHQWTHNWYIYAAITAAGAVILQWYTVICIHHGRTGTVLISNLGYLILATGLAATATYTGLHVFAILAICAALRSLVNIAGFTSADTSSWRT
jgi:hypothetical protein